jgi:hypothetical protein
MLNDVVGWEEGPNGRTVTVYARVSGNRIFFSRDEAMVYPEPGTIIRAFPSTYLVLGLERMVNADVLHVEKVMPRG